MVISARECGSNNQDGCGGGISHIYGWPGRSYWRVAVGDTAGLASHPGAVCWDDRAGPVGHTGRGVLVAVVDAASLVGHTGRGVLVAVVDTASLVGHTGCGVLVAVVGSGRLYGWW